MECFLAVWFFLPKNFGNRSAIPFRPCLQAKGTDPADRCQASRALLTSPSGSTWGIHISYNTPDITVLNQLLDILVVVNHFCQILVSSRILVDTAPSVSLFTSHRNSNNLIVCAVLIARFPRKQTRPLISDRISIA